MLAAIELGVAMIRRFAIVGAVVALAVTAFGSGTAWAAPQATGTLDCGTGFSVLSASVKFIPRLTATPGPVFMRIMVTAGGCTGSSGVTTVKLQAGAPLANASCAGGTGPVGFQAHWKAGSQFQRSKLSYYTGATISLGALGSTITFASGNSTINPYVAVPPLPQSPGSFVTSPVETAQLTLTASGGGPLAACQAAKLKRISMTGSLHIS